MSSVNRTETDPTRSLAPTRYDRVASLLITTLILTGSSVAILASCGSEPVEKMLGLIVSFHSYLAVRRAK